MLAAVETVNSKKTQHHKIWSQSHDGLGRHANRLQTRQAEPVSRPLIGRRARAEGVGSARLAR